MNDISVQKKQMRPAIPKIKGGGCHSIEEGFQNEVLRPVIKMQHDLLIIYFDYFLTIKKVILDEMSQDQKQVFFQQIFDKDSKLKMDLRGLIIGLFTPEELKVYLGMTSKINKRINSIIEKRIKSVYI